MSLIIKEIKTLWKGLIYCLVLCGALFIFAVIARVWWFCIKAGWNYFDLP